MIPQSFIEEVQSRTDIVEVISSYIPLKRTGRNFKALCPFHGEKTPSFIVSPQKQIFHCFGCGEGGGVFQFLSLMEKMSFPEAVEFLAKRLGLTIPYQQGSARKKKDVLYAAANEAALFFNNYLNKEKTCQGVREYLKKRGIGQKTIAKFRIGYAPGNNLLINHMRKKGFTLEVLEKASLVTAKRDGFRDLFINRVTFPIFDVRSRVIGFGGRTCSDKAGMPKYINSLENALYSKRDNLFGLNFSKEEISKQGFAIVVEGYLDMISPFMREVKNIVASLGTALTVEQIRLLKRYTQSIVLVYDSDKAGQLATLRSLDLILENDLEVRIVNLPAGLDPDSLIRKKGKEEFSKLIDSRQDFLEYKLDALGKTIDKTSIQGKTKISKDILATIDKLSSEVQKYEYIKKLAHSLQVKEEIMIAEFKNNFSKKSPYLGKQDKVRGSGLDTLLPVTEKIIFKTILANQKAFPIIKKNLKESYFSPGISQKAISFIFNNYQPTQLTQSFLNSIEDKEISGFISRILMDEDIPLDKEAFKNSILKLRKKGTEILKKRLNERIREAESRGDKDRSRELINEYQKINSEVRDG